MSLKRFYRYVLITILLVILCFVLTAVCLTFISQKNKILTIFASVRIFYYVCDSIFLQRPRLQSLPAKICDGAGFAFRVPGTAAVSSVENKTVVSLRPPVFRQYFHESQLRFQYIFFLH